MDYRNLDFLECGLILGINLDKHSVNVMSSLAPHVPASEDAVRKMLQFAELQIGEELYDLGSGDGRIAYCAKILGLQTHGVEIDDMLVDLQKSISDSTKINFNPNSADAINFDYVSLNLTKPAFFIGGLRRPEPARARGRCCRTRPACCR